MRTERVGFALCGSFCTHEKALAALKRLTEEYETVIPIVSENAAFTDTRFGTSDALLEQLEELTGHEVLYDIPSVEPLGPKGMIDVLVIAPCTGNTLAKLAHGITDTAVTMAAKSHLRCGRPVVIAFSTNDGLSASAKRDGIELIAVVLHCASSTDRFESAKALLNYGFSNYALVTPEPGELPAVPVTLGTAAEITPVLADETPILIDKALAAGVETRVCVDESVTAPVEAGQTLGTLTITSGGQTIAERDLIAPEPVGALRWGDVYLQMLRALCMG